MAASHANRDEVMRLWEYPPHQIVNRLDCNQFRFLTNPLAEPYIAILITLYQARQEEMQLELPFERLYEGVAPSLRSQSSDGEFDRLTLRTHLNTLVGWGNVSMRLEPRRIRRIQDRGLERYLIRLTETTSAILSQIESHIESAGEEGAASARFSLLDVDDLLSAAVAIMESPEPIEYDDLCRIGRHLAHAHRAVEEAGEELLRLDLWLSEMAIQTPDRQRLTDLLTQLETYFERYLQEVDERRQRCYDKATKLLDERVADFFNRVRDATQREYAEDPTRRGARPPDPHRVLRAVQEFLEPDGILDTRRKAVHERLADVTGHLKRYLAELVRRSQLLVGLRDLSDGLLRAGESIAIRERVESLFLDLWQPGHAVLDENRGKPTEKVEPPRPHRYYVSARHRFAGATVRPSTNGRAQAQRPALIKQMQDLNEFVETFILQGSPEALISEARLGDWSQVKMLFAAIRIARLDKSRLRRRYLHYQVALPTLRNLVTLASSDGSGALTLPQMIFSRGS